MQPAVRVQGLGKKYRLGLTHARSLNEAAARLTRRLRGLPPSFGLESKRKPSAGDFWALRDMDFEIQPGEVVGIIGRNGAGKSTLLKILVRVTRPTTGTVELRGRVGSLLEVGTGFHPELTGRENVYMNGTLLGMSRREVARRFDEIVDFAGVETFIDTPVKRYSSGMKVRLGFAVAAHLEPEILIVDEVLAVGDAEFQRKCFGRMRDVAIHGRTILFVSHNLRAVATLCSRGVLLVSGSVIMDGRAQPVLEKYSQTCSLPSDFASRQAGRSTSVSATSITSVTLRGPDGSSHLNLGDALTIDVDVTCRRVPPPSNLAVVIYDRFGHRLIDANTAMKGEFIRPSLGRNRYQFLLHDLLLSPGTYDVELWLGRGGIEVIDAPGIAATFEVREDETRQHIEDFPGSYRCRFNFEQAEVDADLVRTIER